MVFINRSFLFLLICFCSFSLTASAADTLRVLFIGNSYTYYNNLPQLVAGMAASSGDHLIHNSSAPGGYSLEQHTTNSLTTSLIAQGNWDYVVLQEQSQRPSFPDAQVIADVYPYARHLDSLVKVANPCTKTVFYMTWGRKNGDAQNCAFFPPVCTYQGMDSLLQLRYRIMSDSNNSILTPVAKLWRKLINNNPSIELYDADQSHPSLKGSYAAACAFYTVLFKKNPALLMYNSSLNSTEATIIKSATKTVVYDSLFYWRGFYPLVQANFNFSTVSNSVSFINLSANGTAYEWNFGDGTTSIIQSPIHIYTNPGTYQVRLIAKKCNDNDTIIKQIVIGTTNVSNISISNELKLYPNPVYDQLLIQSEKEITSITCINPIGQIVSSKLSVHQKDINIDMSGLVPGFYYLVIDIGGIIRYERVVKK